MIEFVLWRGNTSNLEIHVMFGLLPVLLFCFSCDSSDSISPSTSFDNDDIIWEYVVGNNETRSSIRHIAVDEDLSQYLAGTLNYENTIWKLSVVGDVEWKRTLDFKVEGLEVIYSPSIAGNELVLVWGNINENSREYAVLLLVAPDGETVRQYSFEHYDFDVWIKDIESLRIDGIDTLFVGGGRAPEDGQSYPYICEFTLSDDGNIGVRKENVFTDHVDEYVYNLTWNNKISDPEYFAILNGATDYKVLSCSATLEETWALAELPNQERWAYYKQIVYNEGTIYIVGNSYVLKGEKHWWAGSVSAIRESGEYEWAKIITLSDYSDVYFNCCIENGILYAVGRKSGVREKSTNHYYGSALISRFDLSTGEALSHNSFGNKSYYSSFLSLHHDGSRLFCGGVTQYYIYNYWFKGWLIEADDSALPDEMRDIEMSIVPKDRETETPEGIGKNVILE